MHCLFLLLVGHNLPPTLAHGNAGCDGSQHVDNSETDALAVSL